MIINEVRMKLSYNISLLFDDYKIKMAMKHEKMWRKIRLGSPGKEKLENKLWEKRQEQVIREPSWS